MKESEVPVGIQTNSGKALELIKNPEIGIRLLSIMKTEAETTWLAENSNVYCVKLLTSTNK